MLNTENIISLILLVLTLAYGIHILLFTLGWSGLKKPYRKTRKFETRVSVLIPARNEEKSIVKILACLLAQDYRSSLMEVLVIDDHSSDATAAIVEKYIEKHPGKDIKLMRCDERAHSKKQALSLGIKKATGNLILTTDADCIVGGRWISSFVKHYENTSAALISGPVTYLNRPGFFHAFQALEFLGLVASGAGAMGAGFPFMCNGAALAFEKDAFEKVGGYEGNEQYASGDDVFLLHKILKEYGRKKIAFLKDPEALVYTHGEGSLRSFFRQRVRWGSKSKAYRNTIAISTALAVFLFNLSLVAGLLAGVVYPKVLLITALLWLFKYLADLPLLVGITGFTGQRKLLRAYVLFQPIYVIYLVMIGVVSLFGKSEWKGRKNK